MMQLKKKLLVSALGQKEEARGESGSVGEREGREWERRVPAAVPAQVEVILGRQTVEWEAVAAALPPLRSTPSLWLLLLNTEG